MRSIILIVLFFVRTICFSQVPKHVFNEVSGEEYNSKDFKPATNNKDRLGVYHFGESEGEWTLVFIGYGDSLIVQAMNGVWGKPPGAQHETWILGCKTFNKGWIEGNRFYFGKFSGMFVDDITQKTERRAILLYGEPIYGLVYGKDSAAAGSYGQTTTSYLNDQGDYSELSLKVQPESYFGGKTKQQLKIMRNTIYARYGLAFHAGGDMDLYFRKKKWYKADHTDVSTFLTEIERKNIAAISRSEQGSGE